MASRRPGGRRGLCTAAATACAAAGITLLAVAAFTHPPEPRRPPPEPPAAARTHSAPAQPDADQDLPVLGPSPPLRITARAVGLDAAVDTVGTAEDGTIALPGEGDRVGWYSASVTPGQRGNALLVGHVDTTRGPAAFYTLGALRKGDHITVHRRDKSVARFTVTALNVYERDNFPSTSVYAPTTHPLLTLITCADWDPGNRTYTANLVVTAQPEPQQVA
ncbi:sortase domain-containing protein [Streptomyces parvus]|uniref:sortase domain-containing protein n=1 Tax=Streptomyces parvus TaxID=66428 RepID=UPI0021015BA5|nr:sortase [Streptomyces parvus]